MSIAGGTHLERLQLSVLHELDVFVEQELHRFQPAASEACLVNDSEERLQTMRHQLVHRGTQTTSTDKGPPTNTMVVNIPQVINE